MAKRGVIYRRPDPRPIDHPIPESPTCAGLDCVIYNGTSPSTKNVNIYGDTKGIQDCRTLCSVSGSAICYGAMGVFAPESGGASALLAKMACGRAIALACRIERDCAHK